MINSGRFNKETGRISRYIERNLTDSEMETVDKLIEVLQGQDLKSKYTLKVIVDKMFNLGNY